MPTVLRGPVTGSPPRRTIPSSGIIKPATSRVRVDLPQPDGPTTAVKLPSGMSMDRSSSTGSGPEAVR